MKSKLLPPTYFWLSVLLSLCLHFIIPIKKIISSPYRYFGIIFILFGIVLNLWSDAMFKKKKTTVKPYENPTELATAGPFRISRHPMYLGMVAILLGEAIILGSLITFLSPILYIIISEWLYIPFEEANLENVFGKQYRDYKKKVRRWI
jgi:protein-S-isoprenylcysteine O-methyltransferase Ste14